MKRSREPEVVTPDVEDDHPEMSRASAEVAAIVNSGLASSVQDANASDAIILYAALCRLSRLLGGPHVGEHTGDIDMRGLSPEYAGVVAWAKSARVA